ncbi:MAG: VOC family protein [Ktedonobacteraceae bacterium]
MLTSLDHIIIGVHNLAEATHTFEHALGLVPSGGGIHPMGGTANRIIVIGDTYLELIVIDRPEEAHESIRQRLAQGEGYLNFVLASDNLVADSQAIKQRGVALMGPTPGELRSADGRVRGWMSTHIERPILAQHYPFIIQHDSVGQERRQRLAGWSTPPAHPLGVTKVLSVTLAVENLAEASQRFAHIYGLQPSEPFSAASQSGQAQMVSFPLGASGQAFELAAPAPGTNGASAAAALFANMDSLRQHLGRFSESVCRMTLLVEDFAQARDYLDAQHVPFGYTEGTQPLLWLDPSYTCGASIVLQQIAS